jgi:hypothetical protein
MDRAKDHQPLPDDVQEAGKRLVQPEELSGIRIVISGA